MLEEFLNREIYINTKGATIEDLKKLDKIIGLPWASGAKLYELYTNTSTDRYICRNITGDGIVYALYEQPRRVIGYAEFIENQKPIEISSVEIESLFR